MEGTHETTEARGLPECVPARMLNAFVYCPRLAYIEWVQKDFEHNYETVHGKFVHRAVEEERGRMPLPDEDEAALHARSVWLSAPDEHLTAKIDLVEGTAAEVIPVDYKRGKAPDTPEGTWEPERVQLCAQALVLRANGYRCEKGYIYYVGSKTRVEVEFTDELIERTRSHVAAIRAMALSGKIPPPLDGSPKCVRCSIAGICLPDEVKFLQAKPEAPSLPADDEVVRRLVPARDDACPLYVQEQGARLGKRGDLLEITYGRQKLAEVRLLDVSQVCLLGNVQVTTPALHELFMRGIPVVFFSMGGWFYGIGHGMPHKNVELRQAQFAAASNPTTCLRIAREIVAGKIENSRTFLMRNHKAPPERVLKEMSRLANEARETDSMDSLFGIEGMAAKLYFSEFSGMLKPRQPKESKVEEDQWAFDFNGRNKRPPKDPVNALLSFAYSLLTKDLTIVAAAVGFDPYLGFFHRPRYGRPSLALDIMEEFRPIVADSVVLSVVNTGIVQAGDFIQRGPSYALTPEGRRKFIKAYERRMDTLITHPVFGYQASYRRTLEIQMRLLGRFLLGEIEKYVPFRVR